MTELFKLEDTVTRKNIKIFKRLKKSIRTGDELTFSYSSPTFDLSKDCVGLTEKQIKALEDYCKTNDVKINDQAVADTLKLINYLETKVFVKYKRIIAAITHTA